MNFLNQLASGVYLILIPLFFSKSEKYFIDSQFSHSSGIYFEPISKVRLFPEKYHFISYIDIFQPNVLKYKIIDSSHKLYEYCILSNIADNLNLYDHQTQLNFIEQRINYFLFMKYHLYIYKLVISRIFLKLMIHSCNRYIKYF